MKRELLGHLMLVMTWTGVSHLRTAVVNLADGEVHSTKELEFPSCAHQFSGMTPSGKYSSAKHTIDIQSPESTSSHNACRLIMRYDTLRRLHTNTRRPHFDDDAQRRPDSVVQTVVLSRMRTIPK